MVVNRRGSSFFELSILTSVSSLCTLISLLTVGQVLETTTTTTTTPTKSFSELHVRSTLDVFSFLGCSPKNCPTYRKKYF
jgi:hypothetical protein